MATDSTDENLTVLRKNAASGPPPVTSRIAATRRVWALALICLVAIAGQLTGLGSLLLHSAERAGWSAQKEQFASVQQEWDQLGERMRSDLTELQMQKEFLRKEVVKMEEDRKRIADDLGKVQGQHDSLASSRDEAVALMRRAQEERQAALDAEQTAQKQVADLKKQQETLTAAITRLNSERDTLQQAVDTTQKTLDVQKLELSKRTQEFKSLEERTATVREDLRKQNAALANTSDEVAQLLTKRQATLSEITNAADEKVQLSKVKTDLSSLTGQLSALKDEKTALETDLAKDGERLKRAKALLVEYTQQWNNRDAITKELATLRADQTKLAAEKTMLEGAVTSLVAKQTDLNAAVAAKEKQSLELQARVDELRKEDARLTATVLEKIKSLKEDGKAAPMENAKSN